MSILDRLRGGLIVSVQAEPGSLLAAPQTMSLLAQVAERNGAAGIRAEGLENLRAVRAAVRLPLIGILKRAYAGFSGYITCTLADVAAVIETGADIIAFDATERPRADGSSTADLVKAVQKSGRLAMADCSTVEDARAAAKADCDLVATTLAGYTDETRGRALPALDIVAALRGQHAFVVCEGGIDSADTVEAAMSAGASAVVVGTAITNIDALVRRFIPRRANRT